MGTQSDLSKQTDQNIHLKASLADKNNEIERCQEAIGRLEKELEAKTKYYEDLMNQSKDAQRQEYLTIIQDQKEQLKMIKAELLNFKQKYEQDVGSLES